MTERRIGDGADITTVHATDADRDPFDEVAEEFAARCRRGESPSITEFVERFPQHERRIRELLPSVAMMERLKGRVRAAESSDSVHEPRLERLGEYRIVRELGRGGMGIVYEAFQESLGRHVALKVIPRQGLLDAKRRQRFQREAQAVAQLHHTNIVPIFAAGEHDGLPFYAMQYIQGSGLDQLLEFWRRDGQVRDREHWRFVARVGIQAAEALQYAHEQGILHRDIKPANLLIDEHRTTWITDFGLAKLAGREDLTNSGDIVGTLRYLAPEALRGQVDHRGDIYSLGLTLYELLTLQLPFGDVSPSELLRRVTEEQPPRPRKLDRSIPLDLETIILKATAREPAHRYATAGELADDLRAFLDDRPIRARRASAPERLVRWCRRNKMLTFAAAGVIVAAMVALAATTAGYVVASRALAKADANVKDSLAELEDLFDKITDPTDSDPFAKGFEMPLPGARRPGRNAGFDSGGAGHPIPGLPGEPGPPPMRPGEQHRPHSGPGMPGGPDYSERELAVLDSVLSFYERFAERNATNARLSFDAAKAYRKVAALNRFFDWEDKAQAAQARAVRGFEALIAQHGDEPRYRYELARTLALDGPGTDKVPPEQAEPDLRRAIEMVEGLASRAIGKDRVMYAAALARWNSRRARLLEHFGRIDEAVACRRATIQHDELVTGHFPHPLMARGIMWGRRRDLAGLLIRAHRLDEARPILDQAADDLLAVVGESPPKPKGKESLAECLGSLADMYHDVGDDAREGQFRALCEQALVSGQDDRPGHRRGDGPNPRSDPPPRPGRRAAPPR
jgi:tRNA A-37 threonylcarbamoyl transferase component Bud32